VIGNAHARKIRSNSLPSACTYDATSRPYREQELTIESMTTAAWPLDKSAYDVKPSAGLSRK